MLKVHLNILNIIMYIGLLIVIRQSSFLALYTRLYYSQERVSYTSIKIIHLYKILLGIHIFNSTMYYTIYKFI